MAARRTAFARRRRARGFTQETFAEAVRVSTSTVQGWESGRHPPQPHLRTGIAKALQITGDELDRLIANESDAVEPAHPALDPFAGLEVLRTKLTGRLYQFQDGQPTVEPEPDSFLALPDGTPIPVSFDHAPHELDALLLAPLEQWALLDNQLGPAPLRALASQHFTLIETYLDQSRGADFRRVAYATARHAEFCGWLAQDSGDFSAAMRWTDAALEAARLVDDRELEAYVLMRKSNIATDQSSSDLAVALADASWHAARTMPGPLKALALRQRAHALAVTNNATAALRSIDDARQQLTVSSSGSSDLTAYCTLPYVDMEAAACLVNLGQPADAIPILEAGLGSWTPQFQRDLGLCLARLALAYAHTREPAAAAPIAAQAARIARSTSSHRTAQVIRQVTGQLDQFGYRDQARQIEGVLAHPPTGP